MAFCKKLTVDILIDILSGKMELGFILFQYDNAKSEHMKKYLRVLTQYANPQIGLPLYYDTIDSAKIKTADRQILVDALNGMMGEQ